MVKKSQGYFFTKVTVTEGYRKLLIDLCVYSSADDSVIIEDFINMLGENITGYEPVLERANFKSQIEEAVKTLQQGSPMWTTNLDPLKQKLEMAITGILEQKIVDATEVKGFLVGQEATLKEQLTSAASL